VILLFFLINLLNPVNAQTYLSTHNHWTQYPYMAPYLSFQQTTPYWALYGSLNYSNFYSPTPWAASYGGAVINKPSLYIYTKQQKKFEIKFTPLTYSHILTSSPRLDHGTLKSTSNSLGVFKHKQSSYDSFFYDICGSEKFLQDTYGFCVDHEELIPSLVKILTNTGFKKTSIEDFVSHWNYKIPHSARHCVYPQTSQELEQEYPLQVLPKPSQLVRLWFLIIPEEYFKNPSPEIIKFKKQPALNWSSPFSESKANNDLSVFEWGVSFLQSDFKTSK